MLVMTVGTRSSRRSALLAAAGSVLVCAACASGSPSPEAGDPNDLAPDVLVGSVPERTSPNALTGDQLRETEAGNLYDAVRRLRPQWLRARGAPSMVGASRPAEPVVYVAGIRRGELRTLQNVNIDQVLRVEFIDARDATTRFGTGHTSGVIWVDITRN